MYISPCAHAGLGVLNTKKLNRLFPSCSLMSADNSSMHVQLVEDSNGNVKIVSSNAGKEFAAEEISAQVLRKLVDDASKFLNDKVTLPCPVLAI